MGNLAMVIFNNNLYSKQLLKDPWKGFFYLKFVFEGKRKCKKYAVFKVFCFLIYYDITGQIEMRNSKVAR